MENVVKQEVTISEIKIRAAFTNDKGIRVTPVTVNTIERVDQFQKDEETGEKILKHIRQVPNVNLSDLTRIFALNPYVSLIKKSIPSEGLSDDEALNMIYEDHLRCLGSAKLTFERVEIRRVVPSDEPIMDEEGNPKKNEDGDIEYKPKLDKNDKPITELIGYGETNYLKLELTEPAFELAKDLARTKKVVVPQKNVLEEHKEE